MITIFGLQEYFGKNYIFTNKLLKKGNDYYLEIADPDFSTDDLEFMIKKLKETAIKSIKGNFYIINNEFTLPPVMGGKMVEDNNYCYGTPTTKVHINKNCLKLSATAASELKKPIYNY